MKGKVILVFIILMFSLSNIWGQEVLNFDIETKLMHLGELKVTRSVDPQTSLVNYRLETHMGLWSIYHIDYLLESKFSGDQMAYSLATIHVNNKAEHFCEVKKTENGYERKTLKGKNTSKMIPVKNAITRLYFEEFRGRDSIFSEFSGSFKPFVKKESSLYVLEDKYPMEFYFANGRILKVVVPNPILDFYIVLRSPKQQ